MALTEQLLTSSLADKLSKDARKAIEGEKEIPEMVGFQGSSDMSTLYCGTVGAEGRDTSPRVETTDAMAPPSHSGMPSATGVTPHTQHSQSSDPKVEDPTGDVLALGTSVLFFCPASGQAVLGDVLIVNHPTYLIGEKNNLTGSRWVQRHQISPAPPMHD